MQLPAQIHLDAIARARAQVGDATRRALRLRPREWTRTALAFLEALADPRSEDPYCPAGRMLGSLVRFCGALVPILA